MLWFKIHKVQSKLESRMKKIASLNEDMYNSDVFQILLEYEISRSKRYPSPLSLLQIEMTPFALTAEALSAAPIIFSSALNVHLRSVDIPSKTGNVFMLLLPNSDKHGAQAVCERILSVFKNKFETPEGNSVTFSLHIGATTHAGGPTLTNENIRQKAGEALQQSKLKGANTFVFLS
jgi:diguanylate cyclase (GGDEF)-like protein